MSTSSKTTINFRLLNVNEKEISISDLPNGEVVIDESKLSLNFGVGVEHKLEDNILIIKIFVDYVYDLKEGETVELLKCKLDLSFHVENIHEAVKVIDDNTTNVDDTLLKSVVGIAIGTTRGFLVAKTKGYAVSKFPLPIVNSSMLLNLKN